MLSATQIPVWVLWSTSLHRKTVLIKDCGFIFASSDVVITILIISD